MKNRSPLIILSSIVLFVAIVFGSYGISKLDDFQWKIPPQISSAQPITLAGISNYAPYSYYDENGNPAGHDVELAYALGKEMGVNVHIVLMNWNDAYNAVLSGRYDLLIGVTNCDLRRQTMELSSPIIDESFEAFGFNPQNRRVVGFSDKKIAVIKGGYESSREVLANFSGNIKDDDVLVYPSYRDCAQAVISGDCDYAILPYNYGEHYFDVAGYGDRIFPQGLKVYMSTLCIGAKKGNTELIAKINTALETLDSDGRLSTIYSHWIGASAKSESFFEYLVNRRFYLAILALVLVIGMFALLLFERRLVQSERHAVIDGLTGLFNREGGERQIRALIEQGKCGLFCLFDADDFKRLNDVYGHQTGDAALAAIALCMREAFRKEDILSRFGGDEFAAFAPGVENSQSGQKLLNRFHTLLKSTEIEGMNGEKLSVSIGAILLPENSTTEFSHIYRQADRAMYNCKRLGGKAFCLFDADGNITDAQSQPDEYPDISRNVLWKKLQNTLEKYNGYTCCYEVASKMLTVTDEFSKENGTPKQYPAPRSEDITRNWIPSESERAAYYGFYRDICDGKPTGTAEITFKNETGKSLRYHITFVSIFDHNGKPVYAILCFRNITKETAS